MKKLIFEWTGKLQDQYTNIDEFKIYNEKYNLVNRLGFKSLNEAWDNNPTIKGSTNINDYSVVIEKSKTITESNNIKYSTKLVKEGTESKIVISESEETKSVFNYEDNTSTFSKEVRENYLKESVTLNENEQKELERITRLIGYNPQSYLAKTKQVDSKFDINLKKKI